MNEILETSPHHAETEFIIKDNNDAVLLEQSTSSSQLLEHDETIKEDEQYAIKLFSETISQADAAYLEKNLDLASSLYIQSIKYNSDAAHAYCRLGEIALYEKKFQIAENYFKQAIDINPDYPWALFGMGESLSQNNKVSEAIDYYQKAHDLLPSNAYIEEILEKNKIELQLQIEKNKKFENLLPQADLAFANNDLNAAKAFYQQMRELNSDNVHTHCRLGEIALKENDPAQAEHYYLDAVACDNNYVWAQLGLGNALSANRKWNEAKIALNKAIELAPDNPNLRNNLQNLIFNEQIDCIENFINTCAFDEAKHSIAILLLNFTEHVQIENLIRKLMEKQALDLQGTYSQHKLELEIQRIYLLGLSTFLS